MSENSEPLSPRTYTVRTYGCQMNVYDSEKMESILKPLDYSLVLDPEIAEIFRASNAISGK